jgi:hypothetical protein
MWKTVNRDGVFYSTGEKHWMNGFINMPQTKEGIEKVFGKDAIANYIKEKDNKYLQFPVPFNIYDARLVDGDITRFWAAIFNNYTEVTLEDHPKMSGVVANAGDIFERVPEDVAILPTPNEIDEYIKKHLSLPSSVLNGIKKELKKFNALHKKLPRIDSRYANTQWIRLANLIGVQYYNDNTTMYDFFNMMDEYYTPLADPNASHKQKEQVQNAHPHIEVANPLYLEDDYISNKVKNIMLKTNTYASYPGLEGRVNWWFQFDANHLRQSNYTWTPKDNVQGGLTESNVYSTNQLHPIYHRLRGGGSHFLSQYNGMQTIGVVKKTGVMGGAVVLRKGERMVMRGLSWQRAMDNIVSYLNKQAEYEHEGNNPMIYGYNMGSRWAELFRNYHTLTPQQKQGWDKGQFAAWKPLQTLNQKEWNMSVKNTLKRLKSNPLPLAPFVATPPHHLTPTMNDMISGGYRRLTDFMLNLTIHHYTCKINNVIPFEIPNNIDYNTDGIYLLTLSGDARKNEHPNHDAISRGIMQTPQIKMISIDDPTDGILSQDNLYFPIQLNDSDIKRITGKNKSIYKRGEASLIIPDTDVLDWTFANETLEMVGIAIIDDLQHLIRSIQKLPTLTSKIVSSAVDWVEITTSTTKLTTQEDQNKAMKLFLSWFYNQYMVNGPQGRSTTQASHWSTKEKNSLHNYTDEDTSNIQIRDAIIMEWNHKFSSANWHKLPKSSIGDKLWNDVVKSYWADRKKSIEAKIIEQNADLNKLKSLEQSDMV